MKSRLFFPVLIALTGLFISNGFVHREKENEEHEEFELDRDQKARIASEYFAYRNKQRANSQGKFEFADLLRAFNQADQIERKGLRSELQWEEMGPDNVGGRTRCLQYDKFNPNLIYTGGVSGGIFYSKDGGKTWTNYFNQDDLLKVLSISTMCQTINGDIYVGTGHLSEQASGAESSGAPGNGIYKKAAGSDKFVALTSTVNTGALSPSNPFSVCNRIEADRYNSDIVYAATNAGLKITKDAGATWTSAGAPLNNGMIQTVRVAPDNAIFAAQSGRIYKSKDGGQTWTQTATTFLSSGSRLEITVSTDSIFADNYYVYALGTNTDGSLKYVIQSANQGESWLQIGFGDNLTKISFDPFCQLISGKLACQGWYDIAFEVHPKDREKLYLGGAAKFYSWSPNTGWLQAAKAGDFTGAADYIHADMHSIAFHPTNPDIMYVTCDGGLFQTTNTLSGFPYPRFFPKNRGYNVTQFYSVAASITGEMLGGAQDNGTNFLSLGENSKKATVEVSGGDGFDCEISKVNPNFQFYTVYNGRYLRTSKKGEGVSSIVTSDIDGVDGSPSDGNADGVGFFTKIHLMENVPNQKSYYLGTSSFQGGTVFLCSNPLSTDKKLRWYKFIKPGGEVESFSNSADGDVLYMGLSGAISRISGFATAKDSIDSKDNAVTMTGLSPMTTYPVAGSVYGIGVDPKNSNHIVVTLGGFNNATKIYESTNGGAVFTPKQGNLPVMPCYDAIIDATNPNRVLIASELGMWLTEDISVSNPVWVEANKGVGRVPTFKMRQENLYTDTCPVIYIGTHGRGFFRCTSFTPSGCATKVGGDYSSISKTSIQQNTLKIYPNPVVENANFEFYSNLNQSIYITIYNTQGLLVKKEKYNVSAGTNSIELSVSSLNKGNYIVRIENDKSVLAGSKMVVQ